MKKKILIFILLPIFALTLSGCKKVQEKVTEKAFEKSIGNKADIDIKKGGKEMTFKDKETGDTVSIGQNKVPLDWPKDAPLYKGEIVTSMQSGDGMSLNIKTKDDLSEIKNWYNNELKKFYWTEDSVIGIIGMWTGNYIKGDKSFSVMVTAADEGDGNIISLTYRNKAK